MEKCEAALKTFLLARKELSLPRDLVQQMGFTQLCASLKQPEVGAMRCVRRSTRRVSA